MEKISLYRYGYTINSNDPKLAEIMQKVETFKNAYNEIKALYEAGKPVYVEITSGDWKGSIAKFVITKFVEPQMHRLHNFHNTHESHNFEGAMLGTLAWDGRKNSVKVSTYAGNLVWLKDYYGPTLYKKVDKKAVAAKIKAQAVFKDRDGNILNISDKVLYVNIRYGSGSRLERGTITEKKVKAGVPYLVILREDGSENSTIENTENLVMKV